MASQKKKPGSRKVKVENRVTKILRRLAEAYPDAGCALKHKNPFQLLIATILSAQCTDVRVNRVTPGLFAKYPSVKALAEALPADLEDTIRSTGFFRSKTKSLLGVARKLRDNYRSRVPRTMEELTQLPGVARKTANVVLGTGYGIPSGVVVDTHVTRISQRLGLTREKDPKKIEQDLMALVPQESWILFAHQVIDHGRRTCMARKPRCGDCSMFDVCQFPERSERALDVRTR